MRLLKVVSKILGVIWMVFFGIAAIFILSKQPIDLSTTYGVGYFFGMVISLVLIISVEYFLYNWEKANLKT